MPVVNNKYILSTDLQIIRSAKQEELVKRQQAKLFQEGRQVTIKSEDSLDQPLFTELDEDLDDQEFKEKES